MKVNRLDVTMKIITAVGALLAGILIPWVINHNAEKNRQNQLYIQIMSEREKSDSTLRAEMFKSLISSYFGEKVKDDTEKQIMYLHLLALNFQEFFDAMPLFEDLDKRLDGDNDKREQLQNIAKTISARQISMLSKAEYKPVELQLCVEKTGTCSNEGAFILKGKDRNYNFTVELIDVHSHGGSEEALVRVCGAGDFGFKTAEFHVSYYDMPFMTNTRLWNGSRFALVLKNVSNADPKRAIIDVLTFPEQFMALRDRPYFDEMLSKLSHKGWWEHLKERVGLE